MTGQQLVTSADVLEALRAHYRAPSKGAVPDRDGEILLTEVAAPGSSRRADLVRIGTWASRGAGLDVHEIKVARGDWLRELADPGKAEAWWPYCNRFWITTIPGVVQPGELPDGWGLLEMPAAANRRRFKTVVKAAYRGDARLTIPLLAELISRNDNNWRQVLYQAEQDHRNDLFRLEQEWRRRKSEAALDRETTDLLDMIRQVEELLGARLNANARFDGPWHPFDRMTPVELAAALADVRDHIGAQRRIAQANKETRRLRELAERIIAGLDNSAETTAPAGKVA